VVPVEHVHVVMSENGSATDSKAGQPGTTGSAPQDNFTELMNLIQSCVAPDSWESLSGPGSMIPYRTTLSLVIRQTKAVHDEIADLLSQLRRLRDLYVTLQIDVVTVSGASSITPRKMDVDVFDSGQSVLLLDEARLKAVRELLALMEKAESAAVTNGPKLTLSNGQGAELKLRRRLLVKSTAALPDLQLVPVISPDRSAIRLQVAIGATQPLDALARNHAFAIKKGQSLMLDITDELAWNRMGGILGAQAGAIRRQHDVATAERVFLLITPQICDLEEVEVHLPGTEKPANALSAILIEGNETIETKEVLKLITTQAGRPVDSKRVKKDVRALINSRRFLSVETRVSESSAGPVLIFRVTEKPVPGKVP